jgi:hypothetical protein
MRKCLLVVMLLGVCIAEAWAQSGPPSTRVLVSDDRGFILGPDRAIVLSERGPFSAFAFAQGRDELAVLRATPGEEGLHVISRADRTVWVEVPRPDILARTRVTSRLVCRPPQGARFSGPLAWSPNGETVALGQEGPAAHSSLVAVDYATGSLRVLASDLTAAALLWSPDGRHIAVTTSSKDLYLLPAIGGPPRKLADDVVWVAWSLDSDRLQWRVIEKVGATARYARRLSGAETKLVSKETSRPPGAVWSSDGALCAAAKEGKLLLFRGAEASPEVLMEKGASRVLGWSPDGRLVTVLDDKQHLRLVACRLPPRAFVAMLRGPLPEAIVDPSGIPRLILDLPNSLASEPPPAWSNRMSQLACVTIAPKGEQRLTAWQVQVETIPPDDLAKLSSPAALAEARTAARRAVIQSNLKQIGLALHIMMGDHDNSLPEGNFDELMKPYLKNPALLDQLDKPGQRAFRLLLPQGTRLRDVVDPANTPLGIIDYDPELRTILYVDGSVKYIPPAKE